MIDPARIRLLNTLPVNHAGHYVLYWMQASQRAIWNHALEYAIERANELKLPVVVCFGLTDDYPEANARHYAFMLEGLSDVAENLSKRGIKFVARKGSPPSVASELAEDAATVVCDRGYTRIQRRWRDELADSVKCVAVEIESDLVVPIETASDKQEYAARTIRPKINRLLQHFLTPIKTCKPVRSSLDMKLPSAFDVSDPEKTLAQLNVDRSVAPSKSFAGGSREADKRLKSFLRDRLNGYATKRNEPADGHTTTLSPFLHFGQISPLQIALAVMESGAPEVDREALLEELIVRRELSCNFVHYCDKYDSYDCVPLWARRTLAKHANDKRSPKYSLDQLERAQTHDEYWNAAQAEMTSTGYMHNYMRMYWGKKIIEWTKSPREAYQIALHLNNKYFLDGRDPNSFAGVGWLFGLHDRPWTERKIFGTVRYMNAAGLERKFDMAAYVRRVNRLSGCR